MSRRNEPGTVAAWDPDSRSPVLDDGTIWLHGHVDHDEARSLAEGELVGFDPDVPPTEWRAGPVEHAHARTIPTRDEQGDRCLAVRVSTPGRGAYPVTIVTLERR